MALSSVDTFKLCAGLATALLAVLGGVAPAVISKPDPVVHSMLNMFAGGVFLGGSWMHLLPDAVENKALERLGCFGTSSEGEEPRCLKLSFFFFGVGFLLLLFVESIAHSVQRAFGNVSERRKEGRPLIVNSTRESSQVVRSQESSARKQDTREHPSVEDSMASSQHGSYGTLGLMETVEAADHSPCEHLEVVHAHVHGIVDGTPALAYVIFIALSFHSVMEGLGLGASNHAAWDILVAILAHKSLAAFALALEMLHHKVPRDRLLTSLGIFAAMTPLGIFLGWLAVGIDEDTAASGVCTALAGGTFLFVPVMEIIPQELQSPHHVLPKCLALLLGFGLFGMLSIWT